MFPRKRFWARTAVEIVAAFFLLTPFAMYVLGRFGGMDFDYQVWRILILIVIWPWMPFAFAYDETYWMMTPYLFVTGFFLVHAIFARARFPRLLGLLRRVRPFVFLLIASYFATGWSRFLNRGEESYVYSVESEPSTYSVQASGFPFRFSINEQWLAGDETEGFYLFKSTWFFADFLFYLVLFAVLWFAVPRFMRYWCERNMPAAAARKT